MWLDSRAAKASGALLFAAGLAVVTGLMFWFGLRATREWERSTIEAADTRGRRGRDAARRRARARHERRADFSPAENQRAGLHADRAVRIGGSFRARLCAVSLPGVVFRVDRVRQPRRFDVRLQQSRSHAVLGHGRRRQRPLPRRVSARSETVSQRGPSRAGAVVATISFRDVRNDRRWRPLPGARAPDVHGRRASCRRSSDTRSIWNGSRRTTSATSSGRFRASSAIPRSALKSSTATGGRSQPSVRRSPARRRMCDRFRSCLPIRHCSPISRSVSGRPPGRRALASRVTQAARPRVAEPPARWRFWAWVRLRPSSVSALPYGRLAQRRTSRPFSPSSFRQSATR